MPRVGFEPTIPTFERAKTLHSLDCKATVIGKYAYKIHIFVKNLILCTLSKDHKKISHYESFGSKFEAQIFLPTNNFKHTSMVSFREMFLDLA
jgi:hypothetical protein